MKPHQPGTGRPVRQQSTFPTAGGVASADLARTLDKVTSLPAKTEGTQQRQARLPASTRLPREAAPGK